MDQITTATGKSFLSDYLAVIPNPRQAYFRIVGTPLYVVAEVFGNPSETLQLWHGDTYLSGYTHLIAIIPEEDAIKVALGKE